MFNWHLTLSDNYSVKINFPFVDCGIKIWMDKIACLFNTVKSVIDVIQ